MTELTKEEMAKRIEELERKLAGHDSPKRDWRSVVGILADSAFFQQAIEEGRKYRAASTDSELEEILRAAAEEDAQQTAAAPSA